MKQKLILFALLLVVWGCSNNNNNSKTQSQKPNILFIFADDQRYNTMGIAEMDAVHTPNLDRLAQSGVYFNNCYILGAPHGAVCSPSRAMLMTGRHYWHLPTSVIALWDKDLTPETRGRCDYITMPELLKQNGYYNFTTGKHHNGPHWVENGFDAAKAVFLGGMSTHFGIKTKDYDPQKGWSEQYVNERFSSEVFSEPIVEFIENYDGDKPFFAYLPFTSPHDPRTAPQKYHDKYKADDMVLPPNFMPGHPFPIGDMQIRDERLAGFMENVDIAMKIKELLK